MGFGILGAVAYPQIPEENRTTSTEGENLPFDFDYLKNDPTPYKTKPRLYETSYKMFRDHNGQVYRYEIADFDFLFLI